MISNKLITIVKDNQFNEGWTLFTSASFEVEKNYQFKKIELSNIVKLITFSKEVNLILAETCLSSRMINELEWVNKYIKLNIIAKNKNIIERYNNLIFNSCKIDETININYIGIEGKINGYFIIGEDIYEVDKSVEEMYYRKKLSKDKYACFDNVESLIICNSGSHKDFGNVVNLAKEHNAKCCYVIDYRAFDRSVFDFAKKNQIELFVSEYVQDAVLVVNKDNSICKLLVLNDGNIVLYQIDKVHTYVGEVYKNLFLEDTIDTSRMPLDVYMCINGKNKKLDIKDKVIVSKDIFIDEMSNFVDEIFDQSIVDNHNEYANIGKRTQYNFTLFPPLIDSSYQVSSIYNPILKLYEERDSINKINFEKIVIDYHKLMNSDSKLIQFINYQKLFKDKLEYMISKYSYKGYYSELNEAIKKYSECKDGLLDDCLFMFNEINVQSSDSKFNVLDTEIAGYRKTIKEKEALISKGVDVLSNQRRVEMLSNKINGLLRLKEKFKDSAGSRQNKEADSFIENCRNLIEGPSKYYEENDSIGKVINSEEQSKIVKLNVFMANYLKRINDFLTSAITCLKNMNDVHIPEEYTVFEKNNQRYIVINELSEFDRVKTLCREFSLKCLARR